MRNPSWSISWGRKKCKNFQRFQFSNAQLWFEFSSSVKISELILMTMQSCFFTSVLQLLQISRFEMIANTNSYWTNHWKIMIENVEWKWKFGLFKPSTLMNFPRIDYWFGCMTNSETCAIVKGWRIFWDFFFFLFPSIYMVDFHQKCEVNY